MGSTNLPIRLGPVWQGAHDFRSINTGVSCVMRLHTESDGRIGKGVSSRYTGMRVCLVPMTILLLRDVFLGIAAIPFIYYGLAIFSSLRFFLATRAKVGEVGGFLPPVSNLKPVRGLDPEAYENFASFCRQDYPDYEILFCVGDTSDPVFPVLQQLVQRLSGTSDPHCDWLGPYCDQRQGGQACASCRRSVT